MSSGPGAGDRYAIVRSRLKSSQYRPALIDAFITETGLMAKAQPP